MCGLTHNQSGVGGGGGWGWVSLKIFWVCVGRSISDKAALETKFMFVMKD